MRRAFIVALLAGLSSTAAAQFEVGAHAVVGQRWQDGSRRFHGGGMSAGVSTRQPGVNIGLRFATTFFDTRNNSDVQCPNFGGCFGPDDDDTEQVINASAVLIPLRRSAAQLEFGAGTSWTQSRRRDFQLGLLVTAAAAYRVPGNPMRLQATYEKHRVPHQSDGAGPNIFFRHLVRIGIVYEVTQTAKP